MADGRAMRLNRQIGRLPQHDDAAISPALAPACPALLSHASSNMLLKAGPSVGQELCSMHADFCYSSALFLDDQLADACASKAMIIKPLDDAKGMAMHMAAACKSAAGRT